MAPLVIDRTKCYYPGCRKRAEQWHHVWPRCVTRQLNTDLRGAVPSCRKHHALATAESTLIKAGPVCWEATEVGRKNISKLIRLYHTDSSTTQLAAKYRVSPSSIRAILIRSGISLRSIGEALRNRPVLKTRRFTPTKEFKIRKQYECGQSIRDLAERHNCGKETIRCIILRAGGTLRSRSSALIIKYQQSSKG